MTRQATPRTVDISVESAADLTALINDLRVADGTRVSVSTGTSRGSWYLNKTSATTIDGATAVATFSGVGRWICAGYVELAEMLLAQGASGAAYYVDPVAGDDAASGLIGAPWKTLRRLSRVLRPERLLDGRVDVYVLGDTPTDDPLVVDPVVTSTGGLYVHGVPTLIAGATGDTTAVTPRAPATNTKLSFTDALRANWTDCLEHLVVVTGGTAGNVGASSWIHTDLGGGVCETGSFVKADSGGTAFNLAEKIPLLGDTYAVYRLPKIRGDVWIGGKGARLYAVDAGKVFFENLHFTSETATFNAYNGGIVQAFAHCKFGSRSPAKTPEFNGWGQTFLIDCFHEYGVKARTSNVDLAVYGGVNGSAIGGAGEVFQGGTVFYAMGHLLVTGHAILIQGQCVMSVGDLGIFNKGAAAINVNGNGYVVFRAANSPKLWGSSASAGFYALNIDPGLVAYQGDPTSYITLARNGPAYDFKLGGQSAGPAMNPNGTSTADSRAYTIANLMAAIGSGGFGGNCIDPISGNRFVLTPTT